MKQQIVSVVGTRPEIIRVIQKLPEKIHTIVNTGQHYDFEMDQQFWNDMNCLPDENLGMISLGRIYDALDYYLQELKPKIVISYGDTRSSFAAALAAKNNNILLAHLEAGVRAFDTSMPEERYRIMIDSISDILFAVNKNGVRNLLREGIEEKKIFNVGDIVLDRFYQAQGKVSYVLLTLHREQNKSKKKVKEVLDSLKEEFIIWPIHPGMTQYLPKKLPKRLKLLTPVPHKEMLNLIKHAKLVVTDSGGVEREAFWYGIPLRVILKKDGWRDEVNIFGDGNAEDKIVKILTDVYYER